MAGPVPAGRTQDVCLYFDRLPSASHWQVYNAAAQRVAALDFGAQPIQCWHHPDVAPGLYYLALEVDYADGTQQKSTQKIVLIK